MMQSRKCGDKRDWPQFQAAKSNRGHSRLSPHFPDGDTFQTPNRQYSQTQGRWLHPDPAGLAAVDPTNPQTWNRYAYVGNNPVSYNDPWGLVMDICGGPANPHCSGNDPESANTGLGLNWDLSMLLNSNTGYWGVVGCSNCDEGQGFFLTEWINTSLDLALIFDGEDNSNSPTNNGCSVSSSSINNYLTTKNSPLAGQGSNFMATGQTYNLDARLLVSLSGAETTFGTNITAGQFNALNVLYNGLNSPFSSWQSNINAAGKSLTNPANGYDLANTSTMYSTYCSGSGCATGLKNLNTFMRQQGANTNALHNPCKPQAQGNGG